MAVEILGTGQPDGAVVGASASEKAGMHGTAAVQTAHIADATDAATAITRINAILVSLETHGITATS
jgi:hypothetical protein